MQVAIWTQADLRRNLMADYASATDTRSLALPHLTHSGAVLARTWLADWLTVRVARPAHGPI